jgi:hypothetical protein
METQPAQCPVCEARADITRPKVGDYATVSCWECGCFTVTGEALPRLRAMSLEARRARLLTAKSDAHAGELPDVSA